MKCKGSDQVNNVESKKAKAAPEGRKSNDAKTVDDTNPSLDRSGSPDPNPIDKCLKDDIEAFGPQPNVFEALVRPSNDSVLDDPLLKTTPFIVNTSFCILICTHCQCTVNPKKAGTHIAKNHKACKPPSRFTEQLLDRYPNLKSNGVDILQSIKAIFGLAIPTNQFIVCSRCYHGYSNVKGWQSHACKKPSIKHGDQLNYFALLVQTFFHSPKHLYFVIHTPQPTSVQPPNAFSIFRSQTVSLGEPNKKVSIAVDYRQQNQFLVKEGWIEHINGLSASNLYSISTPPAEDTHSRLLYSTTYQLMLSIQDQISNAGFHV
ncbi:hypothetical protein BDN71DRAFT_1511034 [Pleurotus eryngii]|uniref:Uncharacterized protein n=1 Tax=Pleurotus eryngii TaxID=5323 RepID=A0A9P5ZNN9_PLEER|nr:hypothetical protein BDN71DRAFT_1511034 [Pleurotus eryngii]